MFDLRPQQTVNLVVASDLGLEPKDRCRLDVTAAEATVAIHAAVRRDFRPVSARILEEDRYRRANGRQKPVADERQFDLGYTRSVRMSTRRTGRTDSIGGLK